MVYIENPHEHLIKVGIKSLEVSEEISLVAKSLLKNPMNIAVTNLWAPLLTDLLTGNLPAVQELIRIRGKGAEDVYYTVDIVGKRANITFYI